MNLLKSFAIGAAAVLLVSLFAIAPLLDAQPYYTNSTAANGAYLPNSSVVPGPQPSVTLANQLALGINTGLSVTSGDGTVTNTFSTSYVYSVAPVVTVNQTGTLTSVSNIVVSVTTTNFIYKAGAPNVTNNWTAIGK